MNIPGTQQHHSGHNRKRLRPKPPTTTCKHTCNEGAVPFQQSPYQQHQVIRRETDEEDEDGAADQLSDPYLLIGLCAGTPTHSSKDAQVADLDRRMSLNPNGSSQWKPSTDEELRGSASPTGRRRRDCISTLAWEPLRVGGCSLGEERLEAKRPHLFIWVKIS